MRAWCRWIAPLLFSQAALAVECVALVHGGVPYSVCTVETRQEDLGLFHADARGVVYGGFESLRADLARRGLRLAFAMNAGMFHADMRPVGLLVIGGRELAPVNRASASGNFYLQPNGVFLVDAQGPRVLATHEYRRLSPRIATQSGPMLLHRGNVPASTAFSASSRSRHVRNGVCVPAPGRVTFAISGAAVTFREFALFFRDVVKCPDALYLDGAISSLYSPVLKRSDRHATLGPIFAVTE